MKLNSSSAAVLFPLRFQPDLDQTADGFEAAGLVVLGGGPGVDFSNKLVR
jgi:hypothetical protein